MKTILKSERILWNGQWQSGAMIIEAGKLTGFTQDPQLLTEAVDYGNQRIIPGIFDTHNHGDVMSYYTNDPDRSARIRRFRNRSSGII